MAEDIYLEGRLLAEAQKADQKVLQVLIQEAVYLTVKESIKQVKTLYPELAALLSKTYLITNQKVQKLLSIIIKVFRIEGIL